MPRRPRIQVRDGLYHVTSRGNRRELIFLGIEDHRLFLNGLAGVSRLLGWRCHGYCLMPNHYHLVLQTPNPDLSLGMHRLNGSYAQRFNLRHGFEGHLFERRFHAVLVESQWHLVELSRYLALNPVRAGLCESAQDWPWSSYRGMLGTTPTPSFLAVEHVLGYFGSTPAEARRAFRSFVEEGRGRPLAA